MLTPKLEEVVPEHEALVGVVAETARLGVEDALDRAANLGIDLQDLVGLFLILGEVDLRRAVADQVLDLGGRVGRVQPDRDASYGDRGEIEDDPLGVVLGVDGDPVPHLEAAGEQAVGGGLDQVPGLCPVVFLPDAEVLLSHRNLAGHGERPVPCE